MCEWPIRIFMRRRSPTTVRFCREEGSRAVPLLRAPSSGPVGDPQVVPDRIEDPEVGQPSWPVLEVLRERPSRRDNPVALGTDTAGLEHQFYAGRRQPGGAGIRDRSPGGAAPAPAAGCQLVHRCSSRLIQARGGMPPRWSRGQPGPGSACAPSMLA